ncbi:7-carboxy-7-deazaguanine synthase [compost metagenome]
MAKKIPVMEIFGPTIQGEGMVIGQKTMFLRTGGCDYSCSWCDSAFTWNGEQKAKMLTAQEVFDEIMFEGMSHKDAEGYMYGRYDLPIGVETTSTRNFNHVTISGGNPALIGEPMAELVTMLHEKGIKVGLETQGSRWQDWFYNIDDLTISPKPPSSGMVTNWDRLDEVISKLNERSMQNGRPDNFTLKVVVFDDEDFEYAKKVHSRYPYVGFYVSVGNENATEPGDISSRLIGKLDWLWSKVLADPDMNDVRPLPQLHTLVWANKRGV